MVYERQGKLGQALSHYQKSLHIDIKAGGANQSEMAVKHNNIALLYQKQGRYGQAVDHLERAIEILKRVHGPRHPAVAVKLSYLGDVFMEQGKYEAAQKLLPLVYDELRTLARARLGKLPPGQTLEPTALVHEAYLRLIGTEDPGWGGRNHFFGASSRKSSCST